MLTLVLMLVATLCFLVAALNMTLHPRFSALGAGLFLWALAELIPLLK